jgi:hypothetical protein
VSTRPPGAKSTYRAALLTRYASRKCRCPCCGDSIALKPSAAPLRQELELVGTRTALTWSDPGWSLSTRPAVRWACDRCLRDGRALPGNPARQTYLDYPPYLAYFDAPVRCQNCNQIFVFKAAEQRFWYEVRAFWVQSWPTRCAPCRALRRRRSALNSRLQGALATLDASDPVQLLSVSLLYLQAGLDAKAATFLRRAKNRARTDAERAAVRRWDP